MQLRKRCRRKLIINNCDAVCLVQIGRIICSVCGRRRDLHRCPDHQILYKEEMRREERWLEKK